MKKTLMVKTWMVIGAAVVVLGGAAPARADQELSARVPFDFIARVHHRVELRRWKLLKPLLAGEVQPMAPAIKAFEMLTAPILDRRVPQVATLPLTFDPLVPIGLLPRLVVHACRNR